MYAFFDILNTKVGKLVMFKKMMLVATITSLLIPFFNNTSIVADNYKTINFSKDFKFNRQWFM